MGFDEYRLIVGIADNPRDRAIFDAGQTWHAINARSAMRKFIDDEADSLEEQGYSADAERFREFLANLDSLA